MKTLAAATLAALSLNLAQPAFAADPLGVPDNYRLSMDMVERCHKAMMTVTERSAKDAKLKAEIEQGDMTDANNDDGLDVISAKFDRHMPITSGLLKQGGCPPKEFFTMTLAMASAGMALWAEQAGSKEPMPGVSKDNIAFMKKNQARLEQLNAEREAAEEKAGMGKGE